MTAPTVSDAVDLGGMPQPDNQEVTAWLVRDILDDLRKGEDDDVVVTAGIIRAISGYYFTAELAARLGERFRTAGQRYVTRRGKAPEHSMCSDAYCYWTPGKCPANWEGTK